MKTITKYTVLLLITILLFSCGKDKGGNPTKKEEEKTVSIYAIGNSKTKIKLWKDSTSQTITDGTYAAEAFTIIISGDDVYVSGSEKNSNNKSVAKIWKNGTAQALTDLTSNSKDAAAYDIKISGSDVYAVGYESGLDNKAKLWKNGTVETLTGGTAGHVSSKANAITLSGSDVYVAGNLAKSGKSVAGIWKNGALKLLTDGKRNAEANAIAVS